MSILVRWGRHRLHFDLPPPHTKLAVLRQQLADYTHLQPHAFKLIHAGAVMIDDNAPISAYHIRPNSTLALVGSEPLTPPPGPLTPPPGPLTPPPGPLTPAATLARIRAELARVRAALAPDVERFLPAPALAPPQEHARLSELLLQALLRLDAVPLPSAAPHDVPAQDAAEVVRTERKAAVREVQGLLDRLDAACRPGL